MTARWVEKPPHVDPVRMRQVSDADLFLAMNLDRPGLAAVKAAVIQGDWTAAAVAWQTYFAERDRLAPHLHIEGWNAAVAGTAAMAKMVEQADAALTRQVDWTDKSLGKSGLYGFHYMGWMSPLVYVYPATREARYVEGWTRLFDLWYATRDQVQGDWPGLDVIWYTLGVGGRSSVIIHALHTFRRSPSLPLRTHLNMLKTILGGARWMAEEHDAFRHGNWQLAGCGELLQVAATFPEFREAKAWETVARVRLEEHLELDVYPDGGHYERCPSYHTMCLGVLKKAAIVSEQSLGWRLADHPRFEAMYDWLLQLTTPGGWAPPFNDSHLTWSGSFLLWGHYFLGKPEYKGLAKQFLSPEAIREQLGWLPPRPGKTDPLAEFLSAPEARPEGGSLLLTTSKYAVMRAGWERDDLFAAVNYGPFIGHELEPHSHLAALDFVLAGWGEALAYEAGCPDTYDDPLYYDWYRATKAHNTVLVRGQNTGENRDADLLAWAALPAVDVLKARHRGNEGEAHTRTVLFVRPGAVGRPYWFITDDLEGQGPFEWLLHGRTLWSEGPGRSCRSAQSPGLLVLPGMPVESLTFSHGSSRLPDRGETRPGEIYGLSYGRSTGEFAVTLVPYAGEVPEARIFRLDGGYTVLLDGCADAIGPDSWVRVAGGKLRAAAAWGTGKLDHDGRPLVRGTALTACSLSWAGDSLEATLETSAKTPVTLWAPGACRVRLGGVAIPVQMTGEMLALEIPCAGRYTVSIEMEGAR